MFSAKSGKAPSGEFHQTDGSETYEQGGQGDHGERQEIIFHQGFPYYDDGSRTHGQWPGSGGAKDKADWPTEGHQAEGRAPSPGHPSSKRF